MKEMKKGFFEMSDVSEISKMNLGEAKSYLHNKVKAFTGARTDNIQKASTMINNAKSVQNLQFSVSNFILAHPSENLKILS